MRRGAFALAIAWLCCLPASSTFGATTSHSEQCACGSACREDRCCCGREAATPKPRPSKTAEEVARTAPPMPSGPAFCQGSGPCGSDGFPASTSGGTPVDAFHLVGLTRRVVPGPSAILAPRSQPDWSPRTSQRIDEPPESRRHG